MSEGPGPSSPGHIRAYDVRTGKIRWIFHTIPWPGEFGYDTWPPDAYTRVGGANAWSGISVDQARGLVFLPTGSAAFDFWGGNRIGANLFANCLLVLNAATGQRVWHYQLFHHDMWDRDLPSAPMLVTVMHDGKPVDAVAQATKSGYVFLFDRETGTPLFPIEEHPVPASDLKGEQAWPTQPLPVKPPPFARQLFTEAEVTDISPASHDAVLKQLRLTRTGRQFIPPSEQGTVIFPGFDGGAEWGGQAFDPATGLLYVNANEMAWILTMVADRSQQAHVGRRASRIRDVPGELHGVPRARGQGRRQDHPVARRGEEAPAEGCRRQDDRDGQGRDAGLPGIDDPAARRSRRDDLRRSARAERSARSGRAGSERALHDDRLQPLLRSRRLPGREAARGGRSTRST